MFRTVFAFLSLLALTIIVAAGSAGAGEYYSGGYYGDGYGYRGGYYGGGYGYRTGYYGGGSHSDCCYRKVVHYERVGGYDHHGYYDRPYRDSYYSGRPYYHDSYYSRPYYRDSYYGRPYYSGYTSSYYTSPSYYSGYGYYGSYDCAPRPLRTGYGGAVSSVKAGCPQTRW